MQKVQILLSTYNGEKYLREQLESIAQQTYDHISLLIRDDGSTDSTQQILQEYKDKYPWISYYTGNNVGAKDSYFELLERADLTCDFFAFCDQDDVWQKDKIQRALSALNQDSKYLLYCSKVKLVDANLNPIGFDNYSGIDVQPSLGNAFIENIAPGCTMVFKKKIVQIIQKLNVRAVDYYMHDWIIYLLAANYGRVYFDNYQSILYRQDVNAVGSPVGRTSQIKRRVNNLKKMVRSVKQQIKSFTSLNIMNSGYTSVAQDLISPNIFRRVRAINSGKVYRQNKKDDFIYKTIIMFW